MALLSKTLKLLVSVAILASLWGVYLAHASTVYSQPFIGTNIQLGTSEPISTRYYSYYFGGATLANPPMNSGYWTSTAVINKVRVKRISGVLCNIIANSVFIGNTEGNIVGEAHPLNSPSTFLEGYCDINLLRDIPIGTKISSISLVADNVFATDMVVDGSPNNAGISVSGYNDAQTNGGFAFQLCDNLECDGTFSLPPSILHNPVLIVPGVLGTDINKGSEKLWLDLGRNFLDIGDQFMDSLQFLSTRQPLDTNLTVGDVIREATGTPSTLVNFNYTKGLIDLFTSQGYTEGVNSDATLFTFPYDWRYGITGIINGTTNTTVDLLQQKIQDIKTQTGSDEVDIIAHSTGGLLVKKYVIDNPVNNYIDKAVFVGVPNTGAPKAIKVLLQGDGFGIPWLADGEMKKIAENLPVVYDLSPSQEYYNQKGSYVKIINQGLFSSTTQDLDFNQASNFLTTGHQLNSQALTNAQNLHTPNFDNFDLRTADVNLYSINGCKAGTIGKIVERRVKTILGGTNIGYDQPERVPGDGTVPLESATNLPIDSANKYYALQSDHGKMLSQDNIRQQIVNIISGSSLIVDDTKISQDISECKLNGKAISVFSPLDIDITDQDGNHAGLVSGGIENNIPNVSFDIMGEHKFVYLPDNEGQTYTINIKGTGDGTFTLKEQDIDDNQVIQTQVFSNIPVSTFLIGQVNLGNITTLSLDNNGDGGIDQTIQSSSVTNSEQSKDLIPPVSNTVITGLAGQPSFYRGDVNINLSAIDPIITGQENQTSGVLKTSYNLDNASYQTYLPSNVININTEGHHILKFFSTDKAGNNETEQSLTFTIDKTAPEFVIQFNPSSKDLQFTGTDNLSNISNITILDQDDVITLTDQAGNITQIKLKDKERKHKLKAEIRSLSYNNQLVDITKNKLVFNWKFDKQENLKKLIQRVKSKKDFNIDAIYEDGNTIITGKDQNGKISKLLSGLTLLKISTEKGDLNWGY
ncbi:hypothetical protein A3F19_03055 [Candidatus Nomurabacteria bacterium RIFCSPHIGHO2_12_FULL_37_29]|uniref:PGAP1 family protein n=2 Tax=Candidatus Nomuraibacteriota TaxID=1752729 RepID=A0A1F6Y6W3_9BACT|nr:MAG: hypothetical protein A3F19_03055 [Candidatus Nomurabacteria bacterium RIFCSPHIGHO2_12_FULL_37_29]OGJ02110.1 MAG: hypothetical protein A3G98_02535 [Candidatus Nomurabacteria bacterium RIFCSPLOWO2_12_FULL_37_8]